MNQPNPSSPAPELTPPPEDRRSVTVRLPSSTGLVRVIGAALVLLLIAALVVEGVRLHDANRDKAKLAAFQQSALSTATTYAEQFATYNYQSLDSDFQLTESHSLEPFLSKYKSETAQIRPDLVKLKATSTGKVISAGVASISSTSAVVDLFLNQTISNSASAEPRVDTQRVEMTLARQDNRWLISKVLLP